MADHALYLPPGHSFHIMLKRNSHQFVMTNGSRKDVSLTGMTEAKQKVPDHLHGDFPDG
jgi:hypothetical protein